MIDYSFSQSGLLQQAGYCTRMHHHDDPLEHAKARLKELEDKLACFATWQIEADRLRRMIEAAK